jgi:hypothetical protein
MPGIVDQRRSHAKGFARFILALARMMPTNWLPLPTRVAMGRRGVECSPAASQVPEE